MQTFLISSQNQEFVREQIKKIGKTLHVAPINFIEIHPDNSLKIEDVRKISQSVTLKPYGGGDRVVVIYDIEKATPEAGNALLKILEEPPLRNFLILVTDSINKLLPTIVSRCQVVSDEKKSSDKSFEPKKTKKILQQILSASAGERILLSQKLAGSKDEAIQLLQDLLFCLEELLFYPDKDLNITNGQVAEIIKKTVSAKNYLERYINFKATLDVLFLGFPKI